MQFSLALLCMLLLVSCSTHPIAHSQVKQEPATQQQQASVSSAPARIRFRRTTPLVVAEFRLVPDAFPELDVGVTRGMMVCPSHNSLMSVQSVPEVSSESLFAGAAYREGVALSALRRSVELTAFPALPITESWGGATAPSRSLGGASEEDLRHLLAYDQQAIVAGAIGPWRAHDLPPAYLETTFVQAQFEALVGLLVDYALATGTFTGHCTPSRASGPNGAIGTTLDVNAQCSASVDGLAAAMKGERILLAPLIGVSIAGGTVTIRVEGEGVLLDESGLERMALFAARVAIALDVSVSPLGYTTPARMESQLEGAMMIDQWHTSMGIGVQNAGSPSSPR